MQSGVNIFQKAGICIPDFGHNITCSSHLLLWKNKKLMKAMKTYNNQSSDFFLWIGKSFEIFESILEKIRFSWEIFIPSKQQLQRRRGSKAKIERKISVSSIMSDDSTIVEESSQVMGTYGISKLEKVSNECWAFLVLLTFISLYSKQTVLKLNYNCSHWFRSMVFFIRITISSVLQSRFD